LLKSVTFSEIHWRER